MFVYGRAEAFVGGGPGGVSANSQQTSNSTADIDLASDPSRSSTSGPHYHFGPAKPHYHFGPAKIAMYLKRYHDVSVSPSGIWRILKRANLNRLPASQRNKRHNECWKRYEKQQSGSLR
jgi:hypothetical protein